MIKHQYLSVEVTGIYLTILATPPYLPSVLDRSVFEHISDVVISVHIK